MRGFKRAILSLCEALGFFYVSRLFIARDRLQILCYHGFEILDECRFRPQLFISAATFSRRLEHLRRKGFNVLPLHDAVEKLVAGTLPPKAVVITIDDGFASTLSVALPILQRFNLPATVYVTSYYMQKRAPVFRLGVQYVFWSASNEVLKSAFLSQLEVSFPELDTSTSSAAMWALIRYGEALQSEDERQALLKRVASLANVNVSSLYDDRVLSLMSTEEVKDIARSGMDVQLHTHRHRFPADDREVASAEITENRARLEAATGRSATHFCYPSGLFDRAQWPWLNALGVRSATTCLPGINKRDTPVYGLRRFLDSEDISAVAFRAELAGFNGFIRWLRSLVRGEPAV